MQILNARIWSPGRVLRARPLLCPVYPLLSTGLHQFSPMPESSGDNPEPPPPIPPETPGNNLTVAPRANPPSVFNQKGAPPAGAPPGAAEFMEWMKTFAGGQPPTSENPPGGRTLIPKEQKKFSRATVEGGKTGPAPAARTGPETEGAPKPPGGDREVGSPGASLRQVSLEPIILGKRRRPKEQTPKSPAFVFFSQFVVFSLIVGSFFLGRATVSKRSMPSASGGTAPSPDAKAPAILPADLAAKVDQANAAEKGGDLARARSLLQEVQRAGGRVTGLDFHLALLAFASGDEPTALTLLNTSVAQGDAVADAYNLRGIMMEHAAGLGKGLPDLERAAQIDPFNARHAFFVGEVLRRMGKPQAAQDYLRQALHRLREPALQADYELKLRLAQLESGQENQFAGEMASKLALDPSPADWLLTAAAVELHRGNLPAAAGYLDRARAETSRDGFEAQLRDYYFAAFSTDKDLARFFHPLEKNAASSSPAATPTPAPTASPAAQDPAPGLPKLP